MDANHQTIPRSIEGQKKVSRKRKPNTDSLKVVYISSPMKVKTSASRFRSLVQHLTGKNSDISQYNTNEFHEIDCDDEPKEVVSEEQRAFSSISSKDETTSTSSGSFLGSIDSVFSSQMEEFGGIFLSNTFFDNSQLDVLGSYDDLL